MKHFQIVYLVIGALLMSSANQAPAQQVLDINEHNCAGAVVSSLAGPGFGDQVASLAQLQAVDNLGLADCGAPPRQNP
jgi:hypothetical protein